MDTGPAGTTQTEGGGAQAMARLPGGAGGRRIARGGKPAGVRIRARLAALVRVPNWGATWGANWALIGAMAAFQAVTPLPARAQVPASVQMVGAATLMADQVTVDPAGRLVAAGSVEVWHGSVRMTASRVVYDPRQDRLDVTGPITITDGPDQVVLADAAQLSPRLHDGLITGARVVLDQQLQIAAARVNRTGTLTRMDTVVASTCPLCAANPTPLWEIRAQSVTLDEDRQQLRFERAQLRLGSVPVLYLPRLHLPAPGVTRARGFLRPEIASGSALGLRVGLPYFMPFGDARDLTLMPMVSTTGMVSLGFRWRQAWINGGVEVGGQVSHDDLTADALRGYGYVRALFRLRNDWRLSADMLTASDRSYLETYDITSNDRLSGDVTLQRIRRDQAIRARALGFHSLRAADNNDELPNAVLQAGLDQRIGLENTWVGGALRLRLDAQALGRASTLDGTRGRDLAHARAQLTWRRSGVLPGGILTTLAADARVDHLRVRDDSAYPAPITRRAVQAMIEFRWPWAAQSAGGARTVIEPIVQIVASRRDNVAMPNEDNRMPELDQGNLFALTRYSGLDAPDDGTRLNAGLHWTRQSAAGWTTEALVGRIWRRDPYTDFPATSPRPLGVRRSDWLLAGRVRHGDGLSLDARVLLSPSRRLTRAETNLTWTGRANAVTSRYLYLPASAFEDRTTTLSEWSLDLTRQVGRGWSTTVGWDYDVAQASFAAARASIAFRNACLAFDLSMVRKFVTATNTSETTNFNLQFELLGIGGRAPSTVGSTCGA